MCYAPGMVARPLWSLAIHGGAGTMAREAMTRADQSEYEAGLAAALDAGTAVLAAGGGALDAVEAAVVALEDDPLFNAGRGSVFTHDGVIELDASIMDGATRAAGAVTGLTTVRNPVRLARAVMARGPHVFLAGVGAEAFARAHGLETVDPAWFATEERRRQLDEIKARSGGFDAGVKYGTVGAVALDGAGHVAAATSTGGLTGSGEFFIRAGAAHEIGARMRLLGESAQAAADAVIGEVGAMGGEGGVIVAGADGSTAFSFNTSGMYRGRADSGGRREVAIFRGQ